MSEVKERNDKLQDKKLNMLFIADDITETNEFGLNHNATFGLMITCQKLIDEGHSMNLLFAESKDISIKNGKPIGNLSLVRVQRNFGNHLISNSTNEYDLESMDVIFVRKDPPINEDYNSFVQTLSLIPKDSSTLLVNNPRGILMHNEKLSTFHFPELIPHTLVTSSKAESKMFISEHKEVILKPMFNKGGTGLYYLKKGDADIDSILESNLTIHKKIILQKYLPSAALGDRRIILLDGEVIGAILRIPKFGEFRAHISRGASYKQHILTKGDIEICERIKPFLLENGFHFVGIDVIEDCLIEINFTCPSNIVEVGECNNKDVAKEIIEWTIQHSALQAIR